MAKREWGKKHLCPSCGIKFYDLKRSPIVCPSCGTKVEPESPGTSSRRKRGGKAAAAAPAAAPAAEPEPAAAAPEETPEVEAVDQEGLEAPAEGTDETERDEYGDVIEDTAELGEEGALANVVDEDEDQGNT